MSGKIILNLAMSLDGYIADENGGFQWIVGDGCNKLDTKTKWDYSEFLKNIDVVVMGKNCFNQKFHNDFKEKEIYIATSKTMTNYDNIHFINGDICKNIITLKYEGKNIFLFGGGFF